MQFLNLIIKLEEKFLIKINEKEINSHNFKNIVHRSLINDKKNRIKIIAKLVPIITEA